MTYFYATGGCLAHAVAVATRPLHLLLKCFVMDRMDMPTGDMFST